MPDKMRIEVAPNQEVTALVYTAGKPDLAGVTVILGHGAGADQSSDFMTRFATGLAARGINVVTFNFLYTEQGRRVPDANKVLEACFRAVIEAVRKDRPRHAGHWRQIDGRTNRLPGCCRERSRRRRARLPRLSASSPW